MLIPLSFGWVLGELRLRPVHLAHRPLQGVPDRSGSILVLAGCILLALLGADTSRVVVTLDLAVVGVGMGTMFQTFVIATQNRVDISETRRRHGRDPVLPLDGRQPRRGGLGALLIARLPANIDPNRLTSAPQVPTPRVRRSTTPPTPSSSRSSRSRR